MAAEVLERGEIFFLYRPRVGEEHPEGVDDLQRLFIVLRPSDAARFRLLVVGRKVLPDPAPDREGDDRLWAFVDQVAEDPEPVRSELERTVYATKTRGVRVQPEARRAGEGVYAVARHGDHTHLAYRLRLPETPGEVQHELNIQRQATYVVLVRNPRVPWPAGMGLGPAAELEYPAELQDRFGGDRYAPLDTAFLDTERTELVLIAAGQAVDAPLDVEPASDDLFAVLDLDPDEVMEEWR